MSLSMRTFLKPPLGLFQIGSWPSVCLSIWERACSIAQYGGPVITALALATFPEQVMAHDFWIKPDSFRIQAGKGVGLRLLVGERLVGERVPLSALTIIRFSAVPPRQSALILPKRGTEPAALLIARDSGLLVVGLQNEPEYLELPAEKFAAYLKEEGLEAVLEQRVARGEVGVPGKELYARCAKTLLSVYGPRSDVKQNTPAWEQAELGCPLELHALRSPYEMPRERFPVQVSYLSKPLQGVLVVAINDQHPTLRHEARSDAQGVVQLPLTAGGMWLVKAVHMVPSQAKSDADWLSYWASLTFEVPPTEK